MSRVGRFKYTAEWYANWVKRTWLKRVNNPQTWLRHIEKDYGPANKVRFERWFADVELSGELLELGFNAGKSVYWLHRRFPGITAIDGFDWNDAVAKLIPFIRHHVPVARDLWIGTCTQIPKPDDSYDCVSSLDFFEHLSREDYFACIEECHRVLKPGGKMVVYIGESARQPEHINVVPVPKAIGEIESRGFRLDLIVRPSKDQSKHNMMVFVNE